MSRILMVLIAFTFFVSARAQKNELFDSYQGVTSLKGEKTGWFHTQKMNNRWYFITPEGNAFFSLGITHAVECIKLDEKGLFETKYESDEEKLSSYFLSCFKDWGYNSSGYGALPSMKKRIPYVAEIWTKGPRSYSAGGKSVNVDIFDPRVQKEVKQVIQQKVVAHKSNPYCLGYVFVDCPVWGVFPKNGLSYVDFIRRLKPFSFGKTEYINFLRQSYHEDIATFNDVYSLNLLSFDDLHEMDLSLISAKNKEQIAKDDETFLAIVAETYFKLATTELRKSDPNHLVLGDRFMAATKQQTGLRTSDKVLLVASKYVDVLSFQPMGQKIMWKEYLDHVEKLTGKPILLADVNTMVSRPVEEQVNTADYERSSGENTLKYYLNVAENKSLIGIHRCTVRDYRPWDTNYFRRGLLKSDDTPYPILTDYTRKANRAVWELVFSDVISKH